MVVGGAGPRRTDTGHTEKVVRQHKSRRTVRLRTRVTLFFSLATLIASLSLGVVTYAVARNYLLDQRTSVAESQAYLNAKSVLDQLRAPGGPDEIGDFVLEQLRTEGEGRAVLMIPGRTSSKTDVLFDERQLPPELVAAVRGGSTGV